MNKKIDPSQLIASSVEPSYQQLLDSETNPVVVASSTLKIR